MILSRDIVNCLKIIVFVSLCGVGAVAFASVLFPATNHPPYYIMIVNNQKIPLKITNTQLLPYTQVVNN